MSDDRFMRLALRLAARGRTSPNPRVGCVIVRDGVVLATGFHRAAGQPHAEVEALSSLDYQAVGTTLYVNLEPCSHFGRTPPCTAAILRSGVREVVAGMMDPNPLVEGKGFATLRAAGVSVRVGVLERECQEINRGFCKNIVSGLPYVTLKVAATADGKTATRSGASQWITSPEARARVHRLRAASDAVLVGVGTVLKDNPRLTARAGERPYAHQPLRVVVDSRLRSPIDAEVFSQEASSLVLTTEAASAGKILALRDRGVEVEVVPASAGRVDLLEAMRALSRRGIIYVLAEPGAELSAALVDARLIDHYLFFYAPRIFAGAGAPGMLGGEGVEAVDQAIKLRWEKVRRIGPDLMLEAFPEYPVAAARGDAPAPNEKSLIAADDSAILALAESVGSESAPVQESA